MQKKINIITLGCSKNLVDSEFLMRQLNAHQFEISHDSAEKSDIVIINTCGFINDAKEESIDTILQYAELKEKGEIEKLFVMGCLSERYRDELIKEIPEADEFFGVNSFQQILASLGKQYRNNLVNERCLTTPAHYAYLKIAEGCDRSCSFCAIPIIRGKHKSREITDICEEATYLAKCGVKELILVAQDLTYFGIDNYKKQLLAPLLNQLCRIEGIEWIRLQYTYPAKFPLEVIELMKTEPKICHYIDIPFQHINNRVLKNMRRGNNKEETLELINYFRSQIPDIALRTTLLVGHPGETEEAFNELLDFVKQTRFDRLGVFAYSPEEDTHSYKNFRDEILQETKLQRVSAVMEIQQGISNEINQLKIGKTFRVLIDRLEGDNYIGRTQFDSPDVDNEVIVSKSDTIQIGRFYNVRISDANEFDLFGEVLQ
jgi:ribosomal protein S12 methylthiotransferase